MTEKEILSLVATIKVRMDDLEKGLKQAGKKAEDYTEQIGKNLGSKAGDMVSDFGKTLTKIGGQISKIGATASVVTGAVTGVLAGAFAKAKSFIGTYESAMTVFTRKMEGGKESAEEMYNALVDIAKGSAYAQEHMVSAGQTLIAMGVSAEDTKNYIQSATNAISGFGGSGADVEAMAGLFAKISQQTNLYTRDIQSMVTQGIPAWDILATAYHTTTDEVKAMVSSGLIPAKKGLDTITGALNETNESSEMFKYSVAGLASELKSGTLTGTMDSLNTSFRTFSLRLLDLDPRTESGKENIKKLNEAISSFGKTLEKLGEKFGFVGDTISQGLENATEFLNNFSTALDNVPQETLERIVKVLGTIALLAPVLLVVGKTMSALGTIFNLFGGAISGVAKSVELLGGALEVLKKGIAIVTATFNLSGGGLAGVLAVVKGGIMGVISAFGSFLTAIAPVIAVVVALISVFEFLKQNWETIVAVFTGWLKKTGLIESIEKIKNSFNEFMSKLSGLHDLLVVVGGIIMAVLTPAIVTLMGVFNGLVSAFDGFMTMLGGVVDVLNGLGAILMGIFTFDGEKILSGFSTLFTGIENIFVGAFNTIIGLVTGFFSSTWGLLTSFWEEMFPKVQEWFSNLWANIEAWFTNTWSNIIQWFNDLPYNLGVALNLVMSTLAQWGINAYNWVAQEVPKIINNIVDWFKKLPSKIWEWLTNTIDKIKTWISDMKAKGREGALNFFNSIVDKIKELPSKMGEIAKNIVNGLVNGIKNSIGWVREQVGRFAKSILDGMKSALGIHSPSKLFEKEVGINIALGVSEGWQDALGKVKDEMEKSFNAEVVDNLSLGNAEMNSAYSISPYTTENETNANVYSMLIDLKALLLEYLPIISNKKVVLDTGVLVGELTPQIDDTLGVMSNLRSRGN